ncbi:cytochrome c oxidase subunit IV-domain-containing protein [Cristinia sonorae]|uniref:Cytochrome c oxidase subunit IV-domain-containing protein n=1 Tax=Cristinia sonorae TaxID=1940300 RepID=A0A8K0XU35_9AGAR|nr:cytochrome c oxidase subunit IV-domain-containing protein [Cristinia sonorae]
MQALRLARSRAIRPSATSTLARARGIAATANASASSSSASPASVVPLSNVEAQWDHLTSEDKLAVHQQLAEIQKKDWRTLSIDEKKAAYYVAFGPHGPRKPVSEPGDNLKIFFAVLTAIAAAGLVSAGVKSFAPPPPKTLNKEWEQASNERAIEQKMDPITGISSEGYKGPTFVQSK